MKKPLPTRGQTSAPQGAVRRTKYEAGTYLGCSACGRLLRIQWPTRSVVCSCGARVTPPPASDK